VEIAATYAAAVEAVVRAEVAAAEAVAQADAAAAQAAAWAQAETAARVEAEPRAQAESAARTESETAARTEIAAAAHAAALKAARRAEVAAAEAVAGAEADAVVSDAVPAAPVSRAAVATPNPPSAAQGEDAARAEIAQLLSRLQPVALWVNGFGRSVADAREHALAQLGVDASEAEVEVLSNGPRWLPGRVRVRARIRAAERSYA
jgi:SWI/SNF-related matrix-associated actin-dependent regulator 1 of chromatin subfamily A